ncbi:MAG: DUF4038 domain-containing protein [Candidatus Omnitrophica bacterium]|nr:DUF4038 domain-containing protein [Candidatus Omnitrophota bacterium]
MCLLVAGSNLLEAKEVQRIYAGPRLGQIIRDPNHLQWLMHKGGHHVFICGPGDPEGFLYLGQRKGDGTRDGNQIELIEKLIEHGGNCIYLQTLRGFDANGDGKKDGGGDGEADENPFIDGDPREGIDPRILNQWEEWFTRMDDAGILIYLFIHDDSVRKPWSYQPGAVDPDEKAYVETIVNRFKHHLNLIWVVGEEHDDADYVNDIAAIIAEADEFDHLIGNHHNSSIPFKTWREGGFLNHHAMQFTASTDEVHAVAIEARRLGEESGRNGNGFMTIYSESTGSQGNDVNDTRHYNWNIAMAGVMPMRLGMDIENTPTQALEQCRILQKFFERTDFYAMANHDELALAGSRFVLANPGRSYIVYSDDPNNPIGLKDPPSGLYDLLWVDCVSGTMTEQNEVLISGGNATWERPETIGKECAVWVRRTGNGTTRE